MQWNEVLSALRENMRIIVIGTLGVIILSAAIGFIAGTRQKAKKASHRTFQEERLSSEGGEFSGGVGEIPIPDPIIPKNADSSGFILYNDRYYTILNNTEMDSGKLSGLFSERGLSVDVKPFIFKGEEMDILTDSEDIIEP